MKIGTEAAAAFRSDIEEAIIHVDAVLRSMRSRQMQNHPAYIELEVASSRLIQAILRI